MVALFRGKFAALFLSRTFLSWRFRRAPVPIRADRAPVPIRADQPKDSREAVAGSAPRIRLSKNLPETRMAATFAVNTLVIQPLIALIFGILILLVPRFLNFLVAIYLIIIGVAGLWPHLFSH